MTLLIMDPLTVAAQALEACDTACEDLTQHISAKQVASGGRSYTTWYDSAYYDFTHYEPVYYNSTYYAARSR